ncbi:MAG: BsuPI-related putative proteinase inhibitor [Acidobacteria bacterium]|nr:BsuPI-related putative proteinase inhibitor [Acidobacteriota bacterium]
MRLQAWLWPTALLLALALALGDCGQQSPPPPQPPAPPPAAEPVPAPPAAEQPPAPRKSGRGAGLRSRLEVRWNEKGPAGPRLTVEYTVENSGAELVTLGFSNSGRVCGVVRDADGRKVHTFPEITAHVMGEETFPPGESRLFRHEVRRVELGESLSLSYTVEAWLCGQEALKQQATAKIQPAL